MTPYNQFFAGNDGGALEISNVSTFQHPEDWLYDSLTGGGRSDAGVAVNGYTCLTWCPLWQGVNIIAGDLAQVPFNLTKDEFDEQPQHNVWRLLRQRPNDLQAPSVFLETMIQWMLIWGNAVAWTPRVGSRVEQMIPLRPDCLWYELLGTEGGQTVVYRYTSPTAKQEYVFFPDEVVHIQGLTSDGIWGYPLWQVGKNTIGQGLALQKHGNKQFSNGARPSGVLQHPSKLSPEARENLRRDWERIHGGADNAGKIAILWEDMKFNPISFSNTDSQFVELSKVSNVDAACLLNLPAYKLNSQDHIAAQANLEEQNETYRTQTLARIANRISQECERKLLSDVEYRSGRFCIKPNWGHFLRADIDTLTAVADRNIKVGIWNPNEGREYIGYPPRKGGEEYGNPFTTGNAGPPKRPEDGKESPDNGRPPGAKTENAHRELLYDRILHFIEREAISLRQAAMGAKNFVNWLDEFYLPRGPKNTDEVAKIMVLAESLLGKSISACLTVGLDARGMSSVLASYAKTRHAQILEACSSVTKDELFAVIERLSNENSTLIAQGLLATALGEIHGTENT